MPTPPFAHHVNNTDPPASGWAAIRQKIAEDANQVAAGLLQPACQSFLAVSRVQPARGVALLPHGFTAGPWQYEQLAAHLAACGIHAYAARLPGHGARTTAGLPDSAQLPKSHQAELYASCAVEALQDAAAVAGEQNLPLCIVGFSAGAALAIDLIQRFPERIERAVLISPLVKLHGRLRHLLFRSLLALPGSGRLTDRLRLGWQDPPVGPTGWVRPGHPTFSLGNVQGLAAYVRRQTRLRQGLAVPCQFIMTACDAKVDLAAGMALAQLGPAPHPLWCFPKSANLAHALLTPYENPDAASRAKIYSIVEDFLLHGQGHNQAPAA